MGAGRPQTPARSLRSRAARTEGPPPRASAANGVRLPLAAAGAPFGEFQPPPTLRRRRARLQPLRGFRVLRAAPTRPSAPRGSQVARNPSPARRNDSVAAGWACAVKAKPSAALRVAPAPALTAPTPLLAKFLPPGRQNGLGHRPGHAGHCAQLGGAPAGRGAAQGLAAAAGLASAALSPGPIRPVLTRPARIAGCKVRRSPPPHSCSAWACTPLLAQRQADD